ncbi:hypothetical protein OG883_45850 [Streptomyces sp. NBC_01142]|uniref:hypothetical protein n=1 Tax=Streptomyces sp. NBC_01142 TaxID=2975865 RepID=UPI00224E5279|nr:hypothetical protein [Streptomyces sp. NBC_01142]MCX4826310.1 hypothetical protein [Streptomyces sp. NBC_01142]MCX4826965.1 hypothetical protein [Streptomyces sp. NBC_01142]
MADHDDDIELDASDRAAERRLAERAGLIPTRRHKTRPTVREAAEAHPCPGEQNPKTL